MTFWKASIPAILISTSAFLTGCFDMGQESKPEDSNTLTTSAFTGSPIFVCSACGHVSAFFGIGPPTQPQGFALNQNIPAYGGYQVNHIFFNSASQQTEVEPIPGIGLVDIDVDPAYVYGVNNQGGVVTGFQDNPGGPYTWWGLRNTGFKAVRIGVGMNDVYALGSPQVAGGYSLYKWGKLFDRDSWRLLSPAGLTDIDVDNNGDLWGVNSNGHVFYLKAGNPITSIEYKGAVDALYIACGNGKVYVRNGSGKIMQLVNGSWSTVTVAGYNNIQVDLNGRIWASAINGNINTWSGI